MDGGELEEEREILKGIVAMLLGLAALARLLCVLPLPLRDLLLPLLRHAEAATRAFATELAGEALALPPALSCEADDSRAEALRLARCFRALAAIIGFSVDSLDSFAARPAFRGGPDRRLARRAAAAAWPLQPMAARLAMASGPAGRLDTS
jgi:hypothetical protein